ncbi:MAG: hypothetical protein MAG794_01039 [Gammaproteobacteria bacterium]|nr:hypothetical protein [Gammaproteobacteria bacterium]
MARKVSNLQNYLLAGILTVIPLWITWVVFKFAISQLSQLGEPWVNALARGLQFTYPAISEVLLHPWLQPTMAVIITLFGLYVLGWITTRVIGRRLVSLFDRIMNRIPFVKKVYGSTKMLLDVLNQEKKEFDRVVLIEFPNRHMRAIGFVTRIVEDKTTNQELAAVYVPTTPNPTSGYLELVPVERVISTDMTVEEAMTFIISGGAVGRSYIDNAQSDGEHSHVEPLGQSKQ